jgi:surfeit locus 1 family protein
LSAGVAPPGATSRWLFWGFIALMLALTGLFVALGLWQVQRLGEKEALIATVDTRLDAEPIALPPATEWVGFDPEVYDFRPVTVTGTFIGDQSVLVFTSLDQARGQYSGPGYWVMTPLALETGGTIFINRGFVPERLAEAFAAGGGAPAGVVTLIGIGRKSEEASAFTPAADPQRRIEWVRNTARLAAMVDQSLSPIADIYIDLPAGEAGALPQGGETRVEFPNNHFGYALTWFGFALLTPIMLLVWIWRQRPAKVQ